MNQKIQKLKGANMDIDLATPQGSIAWEQDACPWNKAEGTNDHKCAVKNISLCPYFAAWNISIRFCVLTRMKIRYGAKRK
jgi:hypothetical protein